MLVILESLSTRLDLTPISSVGERVERESFQGVD